MISYNPKAWFSFIFHIHKADTFRKLWPLMISVSIFSGLVAFLELHFFRLPGNNSLSNINIVHSLLGFVISLLLVFRTNTSYDRWWEGRRLLGELTNTCRNLAIKIKALKLGKEEGDFFMYTISRYAFALKAHLQEKPHFGKNNFLVEVDTGKHIPNQIARSLTLRTYGLATAGRISGEQLIILNTDLSKLTDICGGCERIKRTPIPFSYSAFIKKFLFIYVITLPVGWVFSLGFFVVLLVPFVLYVLASLELIAEEIEDPFGDDANDLPIEEICNNIEKHVGEILS